MTIVTRGKFIVDSFLIYPKALEIYLIHNGRRRQIQEVHTVQFAIPRRINVTILDEREDKVVSVKAAVNAPN